MGKGKTRKSTEAKETTETRKINTNLTLSIKKYINVINVTPRWDS